MILRWSNGELTFGWFAWQDCFGLSLSWNYASHFGLYRSCAEMPYLDHRQIILATGRDVRVAGSLRKAIFFRLSRRMFGRLE